MKHIIKFRMHDGHVPYFVDDYIVNSNVDKEFIGTTKDDADCFLPHNITQMSDQDVRDHISACEWSRLVNDTEVPWTEQEKLNFANNKLAEWAAKGINNDDRIDYLEPYILRCLNAAQMLGPDVVLDDDESFLDWGLSHVSTATLQQVMGGLLLMQARNVLFQKGGSWQDVKAYVNNQ